MKGHAEDKFFCVILQIPLWTSESSQLRDNVTVLNGRAIRPGI